MEIADYMGRVWVLQDIIDNKDEEIQDWGKRVDYVKD